MISSPRSRTGRPWAAAVSVVALFIGLAGPAPAEAVDAPVGPRRTVTPPATGADQAVTLISGDRVVLHGGNPARASVDPGPGRQGVPFRSFRTGDHLFVIPSDLAGQVAAGRIDRRLFDVTGLIAAGYDDAKSPVIPVIVTSTGAARQARWAGATVVRDLPVVNGSAVRVSKRDAAGFAAGLDLTRSAGKTKIWLDGLRYPTLEQSVPQIGAPAAWSAGYTGRGVSVAVLDTGIDATHPDLATRVAGAKNFTTEPDGDRVGHGTHVASTIAGTAAASGGRHKGVAPDATLYDGKVCEEYGCSESAMIAGLEWAATEIGAEVVNFSIGGTDGPDVDLVEETVNRLTAQTGTLFVVAAGNSGPNPGTVQSPGSADAALTVGAVDKQDQLADFSSRGPRTGDTAIKPDVTAPGVDVVAAKAKDGVIGSPADEGYVRMSGTSMATPHVAGAAALLAQQHPDWKAGNFKAALMSSAKVVAGQDAFQQGAGRIDLTRAIQQTVVADPGSVSFGSLPWPHDDDLPVTRSVTFRNDGAQPVTLDLTATMTGPDGQAAPAGAIQLSATKLVVPAGGAAAVEAVANTRHDGPDGRYTGRITATADGVSVTAPIAVEKEIRAHTLTIQQINPDGSPSEGAALVYGITESRFDFVGDPSGTVKLRVPPGEYLVEGEQAIELPDGQIDSYMELAPSLKVTADTKVVLDARQTKGLDLRVPAKDASLVIGVVGYDRHTPLGTSFSSTRIASNWNHLHTAMIGPALAQNQLVGHVSGQWAQRSGDSIADSPYLYATLNTFPGVLPSGFRRQVRDRDLAVVDQAFNQASDREAAVSTFGSLPEMRASWAALVPYRAPRARKLLADAGAVNWRTVLSETVYEEFPREVIKLATPERQYRPGRNTPERLNAAVFGPTPLVAERDGDSLTVRLSPATDADGNISTTALADSATTTLYRAGEKVAESPDFGAVDVSGLPAGRAEYELVTSMTRPTWSKLSSRVDYRATFTSAAGASPGSLPLLGVRYQPEVDARNQAKRLPVTILPLTVDPQPGASRPRLRSIRLQFSGDEGKTWHPATVAPSGHGRYHAIFRTPSGVNVSLRTHLTDTEGNRTEITTIAGYYLR